MTVSVCMAVYNGEKYLKEQIESILLQLGDKDELVIVDDCSTDNSVNIINTFADKRIKLHFNEKNRRHVITFAKAIELAQNELILLCDQDDVWIKERVNTFIDCFREVTDIKVVTSKFLCISEYNKLIDNPLPSVYAKDSFKYTKNIIKIFLGKIGYYGCGMAFRSELKSIILPIPKYIEAHDIWIALIANKLQINLHIDDNTLFHRIHDSNASIKAKFRSIPKKIKTRINYIRAITEIVNRIHKLVILH